MIYRVKDNVVGILQDFIELVFSVGRRENVRLSAEFFTYHARRADHVRRLHPVKPAAEYKLFNVATVCRRHVGGRRIFFEQPDRNLVDPRVGTLGGKASHDEKPPGIAAVFKRTVRLRIYLFEEFYKLSALFLLFGPAFYHRRVLTNP